MSNPAWVTSVVVPVHNGSAFVHDCWATLCGQTRAPSEVIFVDDGSTDCTLELLQALPREHIRIAVLSQPCLGPAAARNTGIRAASGALLAFLDVDGPMLGWDEKPRKELYLDDGLHLSPQGYQLWTTLLRPLLVP